MGCMPKIARQIKEQDGEYVLALKANQGTMYQDVVDLFDDALTTGFADLEHNTHHSVDKAHGRLEDRQYWTISDPACIAYLNAKEAWTGLRSIGLVKSVRTVGEHVATERRYYLSSLPGNAHAFGCANTGRLKWSALGARHRVSRRRQSHAQRSQPAELCGVAPHGAQSAQTGTDGQVRHQSQATESGME